MATAKKPAARKPAARKAPARKPAAKKATAARTEKSGQPKVFEWRGLKFDLPAELPGVFLWDIEVLQDAGEAAKFRDILNVISSLVGEEHIPAIRAQIATDNVPMAELGDVIAELMWGLVGVYGLEEGESSAS